MNQNNYKPLYDPTFLGKPLDEDEWKSYLKGSELKLSHKEKVNMILEVMRQNSSILDEDDKYIFNKILGDHKILNKLIFVNDGSYRNNRLWFENGFAIKEAGHMGGTLKHYLYNVSDKDKLNYLKNKYEFIFIQISQRDPFPGTPWNYKMYDPYWD